MPTARYKQISLADTQYYHCISRCVRRSFLCGQDRYTGKNFEHRRKWIEDRLLILTEVFCINICSYAVMNNHMHTVLYVDVSKAALLTDAEVLTRWFKIFNSNPLTSKYLAGSQLTKSEQRLVKIIADDYRERLQSISWFMRALNEHIARKANEEDNCTGRFWEGRFKSQALLDKAAIASCMAYVDLNPIRAQMAETLEDSDHTSIQKRLKSITQKKEQPNFLMPFTDTYKKSEQPRIPFDFKFYLQLVDLTGQYTQGDKNKIPDKSQVLLKSIQISPENWLKIVINFSKLFHGPVGSEEPIKRFCSRLDLKRTPTLSQCKRYMK